MRLLLDSRVVLWALGESSRIVPAVTAALLDPGNEVLVSAASAWEIAIKQSLGKLSLPGSAETFLMDAIDRSGFCWLNITPEDALRVRKLPWHHRDPFDRLLVAQAQGGLTLVTHDAQLRAYGVPLLVT